MIGHLIFCQGLTWLVGFQHPPGQLPSGDVTKVCKEAISPEFPVLRPSPTTLALNKKQQTHQLNLFFFPPSGRGWSSGRTTGQIPIRSQDSQIRCTATSEWELLGAKKKKRKRKHSRWPSLWGCQCQRRSRPHNSLSLSPYQMPFGLN